MTCTNKDICKLIHCPIVFISPRDFKKLVQHYEVDTKEQSFVHNGTHIIAEKTLKAGNIYSNVPIIGVVIGAVIQRIDEDDE